MQSKGAIKLLAILLAIACIYQLSFTFKARNVEKNAARYAAAFEPGEQAVMEQYYLDSVQNQPVYNLGFKAFTYKEVKEKEINLGLDLKGGMNVMLEVQVEDVIKALAGDSAKDPAFQQAIDSANEALRKGSNDYIGEFVKAYREASGGAPLAALFVSPDRKDITPNSSDADVEKILRKETDDAIGASFNILRSRIDHFGVTQPNIQRLPNSHRILVELPGVKEPERVRKLLQGTASLEFWTTYNANEVLPALSRADQLIRTQFAEEIGPDGETETAVAETATADGETETVVAETAGNGAEGLIAEVGTADAAAEQPEAIASRFDRAQNPLFALLNPDYAGGAVVGAASAADTATINRYLRIDAVRDLLPADVVFKWGIKGDPAMEGRFQLYAIKVDTPDGKAPLDGSVVTDARETYAERGAEAKVSMSMNSVGVQEWGRLTGDNIGRCIAIVLDGYVYSAPVVRQKIEGGNSEISGGFTIQEAKDLANVLKSGKVPAPARIIQDTVVGPSLGQESINAGMLSFLLAFILVLLYMGLYYKTAGWMSDIALISNVFLLMGVLVSFGAVLTLPGIAGIVLTMGMAVDANVIIYERVKEELRMGKTLSVSVAEGYKNAMSAIIDGNVTTLITGIVLFVFGTGPVQGFATTLIIGIITSLFTAILITRLIFVGMLSREKKITFSNRLTENFLAHTKFDFIGKRKITYIISGAFLFITLVSLVVRGMNYGVDFSGGRAYVVRFDHNVTANEVRDALSTVFDGADANSSYEVKQFGPENQMRIVTQYKYDDAGDNVTAEIDKMLYEALAPLNNESLTEAEFVTTATNPVGIISSDKVGPSVAHDIKVNSVIAVLFSLLAIALYIIIRFKRWQWGVGSVISLALDALFTIGLFSLLHGILPFSLEVDQSFIAAILTIIGYSINDKVVIFDRIREYQTLYPKRNIRENINNAINSTLSRTINTSGTTLVVLLAIFLFGGEVIRGFVFALLFGVLISTYSTVFTATPIAYDLIRRDRKQA